MFIAHNNAQLYTVSFGQASRTLLALGGWAGSWELWVEPFSYLSQTWRTVAYDHRGAGATLAPTESITIDVMVRDVFAVMNTLGIQQCVLAAESAGAAVALQAALHAPERIDGLVLVDGMYYVPDSSGIDRFNDGLKSNFKAAVEQFVDACLTAEDGAAVRRWGQQILMRSSPDAAIQLNTCMKNIDLRNVVSQVKQRTLIIHGEADTLVPLTSSEWLATQIPQCQLYVIKGAGHVPTVTHPREVADAINAYYP